MLLCTLSAASGVAVTWIVMRSADSGAARQSSGQVKTEPDRAMAASPDGPKRGPLSGGKPAAPDRWAGLRGADGTLAPESMEAAAQRILAEGDPVAAMETFTALLHELTPANAEAAWAALSSRLRGQEAMRYLPVLAHQWGALDGPGALAALKDAGNGKGEVMARMSAMGGWAASDGAGALAWLQAQEKLPLEEGRSGRDQADDLRLLKAGLLQGLASSDPDAAMRLLPSLDEKERSGLIASIAREQFQRGLHGAQSWAEGITDPDLRHQALTGIVKQFAEDDPASAAAWVAGHPELAGNSDAVGALARQWADKDPAAAIAWLNTLPEGEARKEAWEDGMRSWAKHDPEASSTYLSQMPDGPSRDAAVSSLARSIARTDPDAAIQWANDIQDPAARQAALVRSIQLWGSRDQAAAAEWIAGSGLPPAIQQSMMEPPKGGNKDRGPKGKPGKLGKAKRKG